MASQTDPWRASKAHLLLYSGLIALYCLPSRGLEQQEWVLIRTADSTVIASNYTWGGNTPITLKADFSKRFGDNLWDSSLSDRLGSSNLYVSAGVVGGRAPPKPLVTNEEEFLHKQLSRTTSYGCPTPDRKRAQGCGFEGDFYCKSWGCETFVSPRDWSSGGRADPHINLERKKEKSQSCKNRNCNPVTITVLNPEDPEWIKGRTWGVRLYVSGTDPGTSLSENFLLRTGHSLEE